MDEDSLIAVSPQHSVRLAEEYSVLVKKPPYRDFVVRTVLQREANGTPLMSAEIVIASRETRERFPLAVRYPLHFRKTYYPGRLHGDPQVEFDRQTEASAVIGVPPPIGFSADVFRACLLPGKAYSSLSPFGTEPEESNLKHARALELAAAAGLWKLAEQALEQLLALHAAGLAHGDAELHNFMVCPAPLGVVLIDFESAARRESMTGAQWQERCALDLAPLLRHAVYMQCSLGAQPGALGDLSWEHMDRLFRSPDRFRKEIGRQTDL